MLTSNLLFRRSLSLAVLLFISISGIGYSDSIDWTAYNDCIGSTPANPNTTEFTDYLDYTGATSGLLVNDATGGTTGMPTVTFTIPANTAIQPISRTEYGSTPDEGTDAYNIFNGKVDFSGTILQHSSVFSMRSRF
jgi:hypothetical protein